MGKELVGWLHSKTHRQWLHAQVETSDKLCSSGVSLGQTLSNTFVSDMGSGTEYFLSKLAGNIKVSDSAKVLEERDPIQGDRDRLKRWAHVNLMKFSKANHQLLHLGWGYSKT